MIQKLNLVKIYIIEKGSYNKFYHNKPMVEKCPNTHEVMLDSKTTLS
jgi:hypothetical protein